MRCAIPGLALLGLALAAPAWSSPATPAGASAPATPAAPADLSMVALARELDGIAANLAAAEAGIARAADISGAQRALDAIEPELAARLAEADPAELAVLSPIAQDGLVQALARLDAAVGAARRPLDARAAELERGRAAIRAGTEYIQLVRGGGQAGDVPEALRARMASLDRGLEAARVAVRRALDLVVIQTDRAAAMQLRIAEAREAIGAASRASATASLAPERPPIWKTLPSLLTLRLNVRDSIVATWDSAGDMADTFPGRCAIALLLLVAVIGGSLALRRAALHGAADSAQLFVRRPLASAILIWAVLAPDVTGLDLPSGVGLLRIVVVVAAAWLLLPSIAPPAMRLPLRGLLVLCVAATWFTLLLGSHVAGSLAFLVIGLAALFLLRRLARAYSLLVAGGAPPPRAGLARAALALGQLLVAAGVVAIVVGAARLGRQLLEGVLLFTLLPVVIVVLSQVLRELWDQVLERPAARQLRAVRDYPELLSRRGHQLVNIGLLLLALPLVVRVFPFTAPLWSAFSAFAGAKLEVGGISVSLLDVVALAIGVALAIVVSRFVRFVLDEDVLSRLPMASGARAAASRLIYYLLLTVGMLMALAAAGFELSQLTLVVGALGVGIGFGLQNIVNNFVSGIVLAFERPFQAGDLIAVGQNTGRVREIGLRATTVKTLEGADVIVPNSTFISGEVTNWTLSDRARRISLPVGVAYGSDPRRVQALLLEVCARTPDLAAEPAPVVALTGFGESSLDFRVLAWTPDADRQLVATTALAMGIYDALKAAGIEIPFPQREVRILPTGVPAGEQGR